MRLLSRKAMCNTHGQDSSYFLGWQEYKKNPCNEVQNTNGVIQMGLAKNQVRHNSRSNNIISVLKIMKR